MVQHYPEWDGFFLERSRSLMSVLWGDNNTYDRMKIEWLRHADGVNPTPIVLFNAANFFAVHEPELAEKLFLRVITAEPDEHLYPFRLGQLYGDALDHTHAREQDQVERLAVKVESILNGSPDQWVVAGIRESLRYSY